MEDCVFFVTVQKFGSASNLIPRLDYSICAAAYLDGKSTQHEVMCVLLCCGEPFMLLGYIR